MEKNYKILDIGKGEFGGWKISMVSSDDLSAGQAGV
jgi:hypothetical protein